MTNRLSPRTARRCLRSGTQTCCCWRGDVRCRPVFGVRGVVSHLARCPAGTEAHRRTESRRDRATLLAPRSCEPRRCTFRTAWLACARSIRHVRRGERGRPRRGNPRTARHELRPGSHRPGAFGASGARASDHVAVAALCGRRARGARAYASGSAQPHLQEHTPSLLLYAEGLHPLAGGAWLGGLPPLLILWSATPGRSPAPKH